MTSYRTRRVYRPAGCGRVHRITLTLQTGQTMALEGGPPVLRITGISAKLNGFTKNLGKMPTCYALALAY
jgi:hypothetical protein